MGIKIKLRYLLYYSCLNTTDFSQSGEVASRDAHNVEFAGSIPASGTKIKVLFIMLRATKKQEMGTVNRAAHSCLGHQEPNTKHLL